MKSKIKSHNTFSVLLTKHKSYTLLQSIMYPNDNYHSLKTTILL